MNNREEIRNREYERRIKAERRRRWIRCFNLVVIVLMGGIFFYLWDLNSQLKEIRSVLANVQPRTAHDICQLFFDGKVREAAQLQLNSLPLIHALFCEVNPIPVRAAMTAMGYCEDVLRLPLVPMSQDKREVLLSLMREQNLI